MTFASIILALILPTAQAQPTKVGSRAAPPYSNSAPSIYVVQNGELRGSDGGTVIEQSLSEINKRFGVRINQQALAGYIVDLDQSDRDKQYEGFDLDALLNKTPFVEWFHDPFPNVPESNEYTKKLWTYATTGVADKESIRKLTVALAYTHVDHVFFPLHKFRSGFYFDESSNKSTNQGLESVLHEALHIWHSRNYETVEKLLKTKGSYYDRVSISQKICPQYTQISSWPDDKPTCGFDSEMNAMLAVLNQAKWPQRYGSLTNRKNARIKDQYGCASTGRETVLGGQTVCLSENKGGQMGDLHAVDNEFEYFAILMQLYAFSPADFRKSATPIEAEFAKNLFDTVFK